MGETILPIRKIATTTSSERNARPAMVRALVSVLIVTIRVFVHGVMATALVTRVTGRDGLI